MIKISNQDMTAAAGLSKAAETSDASLFRKSMEQAVQNGALQSNALPNGAAKAATQSELPERTEATREEPKAERNESPSDEAKTEKADRDDPAKDDKKVEKDSKEKPEQQGVEDEEPVINENAQAVPVVQQAAQDAQIEQIEEEPVIIVQAQSEQNSGVQLPEEAASKAGEAPAVSQEQLDFVGKVLDEIKEQVVSNEAERTEPVIAQQTVTETTEDDAATTGYDLHKLNKEEKTGGTSQSTPGAPAFHLSAETSNAPVADNTVVVELPENVQEARQAVFDNLLSQVESAVSEEKSELYIRFKPEVFGGMAIRLSMTEEGVRAQIRTSDPTMRGMISSEAAQLTDTLRARGIDIVEVDVMYEQTANNQFLDQRSGHWQGQQEQNGGGRTFTADTGEERSYESAYERMIPVTDENAAGVVYDA